MKKALFGALCGVMFALILCIPNTKDAKAALKAVVGDSILKVTYRDNPNSGGTGFVIQTPNGNKVLITNAHVCKGGEKEGRVVLTGNKIARPLEMRIIESKPEEDLCVVEAPSYIPALRLGSQPGLGQHVSVVGYPYLRPLTLTEGYLRDMAFEVEFYEELEDTPCSQSNQTKKEVETFFGPLKVCSSKFISYDMTVTMYPGNSGSPVLDDAGYVVGVGFAAAQAMGISNSLRYSALASILSIY